MDARIRFETKTQSNARREEAFLALSPSERFAWFLRSFVPLAPVEALQERATTNFIIRRPAHAVRR